MADLSAEKRILLAFALSFLVLAGWAAYMRRKYPPPEPPAEQAEVAPPVAAPTPPSTKTRAEAAPTAPLPGVMQGSEERVVTVETEVATIVLSSRGAAVRSWTLKKFEDEIGSPLDIVQGRHTGLGYPLELELASAAQQDALNQALFVVNTADTKLTAPTELVFEWSDGNLAARKRFRFDIGYVVEMETSVAEAGRPLAHRLAWRGGFGEHADQAAAANGQNAQVFVRTPPGLQRQPARVAGQTTGWLWKTPSPFPHTGEAAYAGIEDRYFAAVFLPRRPQLEVRVGTRKWTPPGQEKPQAVGAVAVGAYAGGLIDLYVGPKSIAVLESVPPAALANGRVPNLAEELVDFGWFWWVAKPLFLAMKWMYAHWIANYGWVIVLLTVIINTALFPLKWKSMESSWKMQKLAPQMKAIQARYKQYKFNDPKKQEMQAEIMALYKQHGVNPIGGCLPLLLQLPFFYGFYKVLSVAIELRQAPWFGWIQDLSQKDPTYALPIVMGATMYISTKMTPMTTTDPMQQRMMQLFPLLFTFFFFQVSAGLVLYWMMSSVVGIGQQWLINKRQRQRELAEKLAAKERKKKKRHGQPEETQE